jgi:chitin-binding protein
VFSPPSRAYFAWLDGLIDEGGLNQRESGKFFPETEGNLIDRFAPEDFPSNPPPADGKIASAGQDTGSELDAPGAHWQKNQVRGGDVLDTSWHFSARHVTRRWNYFITKEDWDPEKVLSRDQFVAEPFYTVQFDLQPYYHYRPELEPASPTVHAVPLPARTGYHVMLAVWEVADTEQAFYQVVDLDFLPPDEGGDRPATPAGLKASSVTDKQVVLNWKPVTGPEHIAFYRITRNGRKAFDVAVPLLSWTDTGVEPETIYQYDISAYDVRGNFSHRSTPIQVQTLPEGGEGPTAPASLHKMGQTARSIKLMWGASSGTAPIINYLVYRDDVEIRSVAATEYEDEGLTPDTEYAYVVKARDLNGKLSKPSNLLRARTQAEEGEHPAWKLGTFYATGVLVSHAGAHWRCLQQHTAHAPDWAPGLETSETLWVRA